MLLLNPNRKSYMETLNVSFHLTLSERGQVQEGALCTVFSDGPCCYEAIKQNFKVHRPLVT